MALIHVVECADERVPHLDRVPGSRAIIAEADLVLWRAPSGYTVLKDRYGRANPAPTVTRSRIAEL